ncbi:boophilin-G2-like isoform X2 [Dermacentor albipictus]|uniref:boophilin-G2-like isoform X2 n=1 Tax=Dermacentor albipictus TaxID=60249 RepID=UPI0031FD03DD
MHTLGAFLAVLAGVQLISAQGAAKCKLPPDEGRCDEKLQRFFFNVTSGFCELFTYNGCDGNQNNFAAYKECIDECQNPCRDPLGAERCRDGVQDRYYFDVDAGRCKKTGYGFCSGYWDSFIRLEACKTRCEDVCSKPMDPGTCHVKLHRFYYDREENRCLPFVYTGCLGNGNRFHTRAMCNKMCRRGCD